MRTSVIIVSYNSCAYLAACIKSVASQLESDDELIVVDNGSSDGSADLVHDRFGWVRLLRGENVGYAGGNNRGAALAQGRYLVFLNPDTRLAPGALAALIAPLAQPDDVALTTACIVHMTQPNMINACGNTIHYTGLTYCRGAGQPRTAYTTACDVDAVSGAAFAIRREVFAELGGFDETFFLYVEDTDLSWRARLGGYRIRYVPQAVVEHAYTMNYTPTKAYYVDRNRHLMLLKNVQRETYLRLLPGLLLSEVITWAFLLLKGPRYWGVKLKVYGALWWKYRELRATTGISNRPPSKTYQLELEPMVIPMVARLIEMVLNPAFRLAQYPLED